MKQRFLLAMVMIALCLPAWGALRGDLNGDGIVDVTDVGMIIDMVLGKADLNYNTADLDGNYVIDVADVNAIIDIVLGKAPAPDADLGIYAGIVGFNDKLYTKPVSLLNSKTRSDFTSFVYGLGTRKGTVLYWAVDNALNMLDQAPKPKDLSSVMLVTFTDGLDQGSMMYNSTYVTNDAYLSALQQRIKGTFKGLPLTAFSIGLRGSDVTDMTQFRVNLRQLASSDGNAVEVTDMTGVNEQLAAIANQLKWVTKTQDLRVTIPGQANGTKIRFTFDNVSDAANSSLYIEGTFRLSDRSLRSVTYHGLTCTSGSAIEGTVDGIFVTYQFLNTRRAMVGEILPTSYIQQWSYVSSSGKWQRNSEFTPGTDTEQTIHNTSALIVLALDCSSSLSGQFGSVQNHACTFIETLSAAAPPPPAVITASVGKLDFETYTGKTVTKTFTVRGTDLTGPVTAEITKGGDVFSVSPTTISQSGTTVTVTYSPESSGTHSGVLKLTSENAQPVMVTLEGKALPPVITVSADTLKMECYTGSTATKTFTVRGTGLSADVIAEVTKGGDVFSVSPSTISQSSATNGATVTVTYSPKANGTQSGVLKLTSENAQPVMVTLEGKAEPEPEPEIITVNGVSFKMVPVQGGTFRMGGTWVQGSDAQDREYPTHQVTLSSYSIGETEVTQELWQAVMGSNPSYFSSNNGYSTNLQRPVENVTWNDCQTFITKLNQLTGKSFRLPTEAEWEYAARGGDKSEGYKYSGSNTIDDVAWYYDNAYSVGNSSPNYGTHSVATKAPNELGLYDMSGNVWEWCQDWYGSYSSSAQTNPTGPSSGSYRVDRGGSWDLSARLCRVSNRGYCTPGACYSDLGLRLAL